MPKHDNSDRLKTVGDKDWCDSSGLNVPPAGVNRCQLRLGKNFRLVALSLTDVTLWLEDKYHKDMANRKATMTDIRVNRFLLYENLGEAHRKHAYQLMAISLGMVFLVPDSVLWHWVYLVCVGGALVVGYVVFMRKYYWMHEEYLRGIGK